MGKVTDRVTGALVTRLRELAAAGASMTQAARALSLEFLREVTIKTVEYHAKKHGIRFHGRSGPERRVKRPLADAELPEIAEKDRLIVDLQFKLAETRRLYKEALKTDTVAERLIESARSALKSMPPVDNEPFKTREKTTKHEQAAVVLMSCLHFGEVIDASSTMGLSEYNPQLAAARWQLLVDSTLDLVVNHHRGERIEKLYIVDVGDNVPGDIHLELQKTNAFPLGAQLVRAAYMLAAGVRDLSAHFREVEFIGTVGNHARFEKKPEFKKRALNNGDWVIYQFMKGLLADQPNVTVAAPSMPWVTVNILGHEFFFAHGDTLRMWFNFPWYDTTRFVTQMAQLLVSGNQPYPEYWGFGHFHQSNITQLSFGEWLFTGSFTGPTEYSIGKLRAGAQPCQLFFGVHPRRGVSFRYPVVLSDATVARQDRYQRFADPLWTP